jgi:CDP-L-myo-inositol myo-inositolphosphotransferase
MVDKAVILLRPGSGKNILGLPLLLRAILAGRQAGVKTFFLIGPGKEAEPALVESIKNDRRILSSPLDLHYLQAEAFSSPGNPAAQELFNSPEGFLVLDGDLVFDPSLLDEVKFFEFQNQEIIIFKTGPDAATSDSNSNWTGLAIISGSLLPGLLTGFGSGNDQGSELLTTLPSAATIRYLTLSPGHFLLRVNSRESGKKAEKVLLSTARKPQDGFIARHFNRHVSLFLSQRLIKLRVSPSLLSFLNFLIGLVGAWLAALGRGYWTFFLAGLCFELASIFDGCDGEVARLTYNTSDRGAFSDVLLDASSYIIFFSGLALGLYRYKQDSNYLTLMIIFLLSAAWYYYNLARYSRSSGIGKKIFLVAKEIESRPEKEKKLSLVDKIAAKVAFAVRRDFFATAVFVLLALGQAPVVIYLICSGSLAESIYFHFYVQKKLVSQSAEIN